MALQRHYMQTTSPSLLPILRSRGLADLLAFLFLAEDEGPFTLSQISDAIKVAPSTVKREIDRLEEAQIVGSLRVGRNRVVAVNRASPLYPELRALLFKAFGPLPALRDALRGVEGIDEAYIFGSWARRYGAEIGHFPRDVDVVVVGDDADPDAVYVAAGEVERLLGLDVNPTIVNRDEWEAAPTPFLQAVRAGPLVPVMDVA
jgi:predicted nucleotidyltransferase